MRGLKRAVLRQGSAADGLASRKSCSPTLDGGENETMCAETNEACSSKNRRAHFPVKAR